MKSRHEKGHSIVVTSLIAVSFAMALILATVGTGVISNDAEAREKNKQMIKKQQSKVLVPPESKSKQDCQTICTPAVGGKGNTITGGECTAYCDTAPIAPKNTPGYRAPAGDPGDILP